MNPYIIPIFIPHYGCRHDCVFCNQRKITGMDAVVGPEMVNEVLSRHISNITQPRRIEVAFYGGSFTAISKNLQRSLLQPVFQLLSNGVIHAIRVSTRPDAIDEEVIALLTEYGVLTVELGVQSMDAKVLEAAGRGHGVDEVVRAVNLLKSAGFSCGIQLMPGLPQEDWQSLILTAFRATRLNADFARIYPTVVIADTRLADMYLQGVYQPLSLEEAIRRAAFLKLMLQRQKIKVIRTGLQATEELSLPGVVLDGPYHPAFGELTDSYLFYVMGAVYFEQRCSDEHTVVIHHHPLDHSKARGQANRNLRRWQHKYGPVDIQFIADGDCRGELRIASSKREFLINTEMLLDL
ncbi:MAG: Radical domain protein [Firmicutes bacterium]|nr:Radical domain protein [Bacillota bacterium]